MEQHDVVSSALRAGAWMRRAGWQVARRLPGGRLAEREMRRIEDAILDEVRRLLEGRTAPGNTSYAEGPGANGEASLRDGMAALLARSIESDRAASEEELHATILRQLVPDEARILAALSDGSAYPVIDVVTRDRTLLRNLRNLLTTKVQALDEDEFEGLLRPVFKQDEWILITVGALLGFFVGEIQALLLEHFAR